MRLRPSAVLATVTILASYTGASSMLPSSEVTSSNEPAKLMFVGDSITHGQEGDYTWRYRLWEWLKDSNVHFQFVGPYTGTAKPADPGEPQLSTLTEDDFDNFDPEDYPRIKWGYAEDVRKDFDAHHFATSGYTAKLAQDSIAARVKEYDPDLLLVMLGFNDLAWDCKEWVVKPFNCKAFLDASDLLPRIKTLVDNARAVKPNIKFAISNIVHRTLMLSRQDITANTPVYNAMLKDAIPSWSTEQSPIYHVDVAGSYSCGPDRDCPGAFDGLHPNALGNYEIASAFSETLVKHYGLGSGHIRVPQSVPDREVPPPTILRADGTTAGAKFTWDRIYGITDYDVGSRINEDKWLVVKKFSNQSETTLATTGVKVDYRIRSCYGSHCGEWSQIVSTKTGQNAISSAKADAFKKSPRRYWTDLTYTDHLLGVIYISLAIAVAYALWQYVTRTDIKVLWSSSQSWLYQLKANHFS